MEIRCSAIECDHSAGTIYAAQRWLLLKSQHVITLAGGTLSCSNFTTTMGKPLNQRGGAGRQQSAGLRRLPKLGWTPFYYGLYTFTAGGECSNISITQWIMAMAARTGSAIPVFFSLSHLCRLATPSNSSTLYHFQQRDN